MQTNPLVRLWRRALHVCTALSLLSACAGADEPLDELEPDAELETLPLELASSVKTLVQGIGDAENATFSSDGRLFVTGGANVYEIKRQGSTYSATPLYAGTCNFTGIVEQRGYLYTACAEGDPLMSTPHLLAAPLAGTTQFKIIYTFTKLGFPNGMAFDARGRLFVADFTPLLGKIVTLSFGANAPLSVAREDLWHDGHPLANGLKIYQGKVYLTDLNQIKVIPIRADGSAGQVGVLATRLLAVFDDLYVSASGIIAGDFYGGRLVSYSLSGQLLRETPKLFSAPSSITPARAPFGPEGSLLVTEKGALFELESTDGNRLSLYTP